MTQPIILNEFTIILDKQAFVDKMRLRPGTKRADELWSMLQEAQEIVAPKAAIKICNPEIIDLKTVRLENTLFSSEKLCEALQHKEQVFPYLITCGCELAEWSKQFKEMAKFMADEIMLAILKQAQGQLGKYISSHFKIADLAKVNPGFLPTWPIIEQKPFFELMGSLANDIKLELLPSCLMEPAKSGSGIYFSN